MRQFLLGVVASIGFWSLANPAVGSEPVKKEGGCGSHGTGVDFFDTPAEAAAQAKKQEKLVFVLHVSGNFEDPRFT